MLNIKDLFPKLLMYTFSFALIFFESFLLLIDWVSLKWLFLIPFIIIIPLYYFNKRFPNINSFWYILIQIVFQPFIILIRLYFN